MDKRIRLVYLVFMLSACNNTGNKTASIPASIYKSPVVHVFPAKQPYHLNVITGDSIKPFTNSKGQLIQTGVPIPANMDARDTGFLLPPVTVAAQWELIDTLESNTNAIIGIPDTIPLDEKKLVRLVTQSGFTKDSVLTGVPVAAKADTVPCLRPELKRMLPMSVRPNSRYNIKELNSYHGLISSSVFHVMEDNRGNLWFSTSEGLVCYDGQYSQTFGKKNGLMADVTFYSFQDSKGNIWIYSGGKGVSCYDGKNFIHYKTLKTGPAAIGGSSGFAEDKNGNIWIKSLVDGVSRFDGKRFTHFAKKDGMKSNNVRGMMVDSKNRLWLGSRNGISIFDGSGFMHLTKADGLNHDVVSCFKEDRKGNIWIGTDSGVAVYNGKNLVRFTQANGLSGNYVGDIDEDLRGNIWISTYDKGISRFDGKTFTVFGITEGIAESTINNIAIDKSGNTWIVSGKGVSCYQEINIARQMNLPGYADRNLNALVLDKNGVLIFGDQDRGLYKLTGNLLYKLSDTDSISTGHIFPLLSDNAGNLWYYIRENNTALKAGLACLNGNSIQFYRSRSLQFNDFVRSVTQDSKGRLLIGTTRGVLILEAGKMEWVTIGNGLLSNNVFKVLESRDGGIWFASIDGLTKFKGSTFIHYTEYEGMPGRGVSNIKENEVGGLWFSTNNGIGYLFGNELMRLTEAEGTTSGKIYFLKGFDKNKNIWFNSSNGIFRIPANYLLQIKKPALNQKGLIRFTEKDGLLSPLMILGDITDDKVIFQSVNSNETGVLNIENIDSAFKDVPVVIKNLVINNNDIDFNLPDSFHGELKGLGGSTPFYNLPRKPILPYDQNNLLFQFAQAGEYTNDQLLFSYKLAGLDNKWSTASQEPFARYPYVPPGNYTFMVRALNRHQQWGKAAEFKFTIKKPFWQEWWFISALSILVIGIGYLIFTKRIAAIRKRENEKSAAQQKISELEYRSKQDILDERLRISSELHDEVGATLSGIAMYSHLAKEQLQDGANPLMKNSLSIIQQNAGEMVNKLNDIVWLINPGNDNLQQLLQRLEDYAVQMAAVKNIRVKSNINGHHSKYMLPAETRRNIYLLFKEAINNAVKYSNASLFAFIVTEEQSGITLEFTDNGNGFDAGAVKAGNGLSNMANRAEVIKAHFKYLTMPGKGTQIIMHLPQ